ncbi:B12-binding domain-containing radical SAM protein [Paenibacillus sp. FSL H3-0333]|uniref:B12-binding domain-containing radical SAM protein n=1 Tax=Paenibacillus sp. FSL H3-0333 TaxID=2921373 RepID=UPI0030FB3B7F
MHKPLVIFVTTATSSNKTAEENLGLGYLAATCRENNIEVRIIDGWLEELTSEEIINRILSERQPLLVGFSCNLLTGDAAINIVNQLKTKNYSVPFIAGGFAPTLNPKKFLDSGFDFVSLAEGEETIKDYCDHLLNGKPALTEISGLCYYDELHNLCFKKPNCRMALDEIPFPSRDTMNYVIKHKIPVSISTTRGCKASCLFCSIAAYWRTADGPRWRGRSAYNIVDEIEQLYHKGARYFKFVDDSFIEPPRDAEWCNNFADEIHKRGLDIGFRITMRADRVSEDIITALCRAGCDSIVCGVENFSNKALRRMGKKADSKENTDALDLLKKHNIYVLHGFILFDYATTLDELRENYEVLNEYSWAICKGIFSEMYAATGTRYTEILRRKGLIYGDERFENYTYQIEDDKANMVYKALKDWHVSHNKIYDMMVEPINKPRVLSKSGSASFYILYLDIRRRDLEFMGEVLDIVEGNLGQSYLDEFVKKTIRNSMEWFEDYANKVECLYDSEEIVYMAEEDPFTLIEQ